MLTSHKEPPSEPPSQPPKHHLRDWREFRGLSRGDLARRTGITASEIADYETGARRIRLADQFRLMHALHIGRSKFFSSP
jgi:transcriptional regulator with XRE-family HTH domain